jgi:hypothetical protein
MQAANQLDQTTFVKAWVWLFPLTYLAHIAEEYWGGFYRWIAHIIGGELTAGQFLSLNTIFWLVMTAMIALAFFSRAGAWLVIAFGTVVLINGSAHVLGSLFTRSYSPGAVSGLLLWIPLGVFTLRRAWCCVSRGSFIAGLLTGIALHAVVTLSALSELRREG